MAKRRWKPKEIRAVLLKLGFIEKQGRGKGDHCMYFKTIETLERAYSSQYRRDDYEAHLLKVLQ